MCLAAEGGGTWLQAPSPHYGEPDADQQLQPPGYAASTGPQRQHQQGSGQCNDGKCLAQPSRNMGAAEPQNDTFAPGPPPRFVTHHQRQGTPQEQDPEAP